MHDDTMDNDDNPFLSDLSISVPSKNKHPFRTPPASLNSQQATPTRPSRFHRSPINPELLTPSPSSTGSKAFFGSKRRARSLSSTTDRLPETPHVESRRHERDIPYPPDEIGEEMSPHARVWRVYMNEGSRFDSDMVEGMNHSLDVLLVFAGLFSAVVTTFLVQSSQLLQPDYNQASALLLSELISLQRASAQGISFANVPSSENISSSFRPTARNRWINALWYISLACSLSSAFMSMLVKQWLHAYISDISGSPQERVRLRHFRYMGLKAWHVPGMVGGLPALMHISLLLFFLGLIQLLQSLDAVISRIVTCLVTLSYLIYGSSVFLPIFHPQCPYKSPLSEYFLRVSGRTRRLYAYIVDAMRNKIQASSFGNTAQSSPPPILPSITSETNDIGLDGTDYDLPNSLKRAEWDRIQKDGDRLDAYALSWLFAESADEGVVAIALQALAGLRRDFKGFTVLHSHSALPLAQRAFQTSMPSADKLQLETPDEIERAGRYGRAILHLAHALGPGARSLTPASVRLYKRLSENKTHPDIAVLSSCAIIRHSEFGLKTLHRGVEILQKAVEGDLTISTHALIILLDTIAESVLIWGVPADGIPCVSAMPVFTRLIDTLQPTSQSRLSKAISIAFYLCVTPRSHAEKLGAASMDVFETPDTYHLMVRGLISILDNHHVSEDAELALPLAVNQLSTLLLETKFSDVPTAYHSSYIDHSDAAIVALVRIFQSGRITDGSMTDARVANVLFLFSRYWEDMPFKDAGFMRALIQVLHSAQLGNALASSMTLVRGCLTECSPELCRELIDVDGLDVLLKCANPSVPKLSSIAGLTICAFAESVALNHRKNENMTRELDCLFQSQAVAAMCTRAGSQSLSLFDVHRNWLPPLQSLCRIRPQEPVWKDAMKTFIEPVTELVRKVERVVLHLEDQRLDLGKSIMVALDELKSLIGIKQCEESS